MTIFVVIWFVYVCVCVQVTAQKDCEKTITGYRYYCVVLRDGTQETMFGIKCFYILSISPGKTLLLKYHGNHKSTFVYISFDYKQMSWIQETMLKSSINELNVFLNREKKKEVVQLTVHQHVNHSFKFNATLKCTFCFYLKQNVNEINIIIK